MTIRDVSRGCSGQTIYQLMLIIACVALAVATFFPTFDYMAAYRGAVEGGGASLRPGVAAPPTGAGSTPTTTTPTPGDTTSTTVPAAAPGAPAAPAAGGGA